MRLLSLFLLCLLAMGSASAHEVRPGFLEITQEADGVFKGRLRQPIVAIENGFAGGLNLTVRFPDGCAPTSEPRYERADRYQTEWFEVSCDAPFDGREIVVDGLRNSITDVYATFTDVRGEAEHHLLSAREPAFAPGAGVSFSVLSYLWIGVEHLLGGIDHMLFVLGLILLVTEFRRLLVVATAFTIAHSITLALAVLDVVRLPIPPVEAGIALSIVFLAYELSKKDRSRASIGRQHPELIAGGFGLLHGFGFAGALASTGMPAGQIAPALFLFNVGVELGQVLVIVAISALLLLARKISAQRETMAREALTWTLGIGSGFFFAGAMANMFAAAGA